MSSNLSRQKSVRQFRESVAGSRKSEARQDASVDEVYPAFGAFDVAVLDADEGVVQLLGDRPHLGFGMEDMELALVVDAADGRYDRGGAAGARFGELVDLVDVAVPLLGLHVEMIAREVEQ